MGFMTMRWPALKDAWFALLAASAFAPAAFAGCTLPPAPSKVPDGMTASEPEMLTAMRTLKRYDGDVSVYLKCLGFEVKQGRLSVEEGARLHNAALERLKKAADLFNAQMRVFRGE